MQTKMLQDLLSKRVSRREFLSYAGAAVLAATGIYGLIKNLTTAQKVTHGYGSGNYGGTNKLF